jgi:hypothetical protein
VARCLEFVRDRLPPLTDRWSLIAIGLFPSVIDDWWAQGPRILSPTTVFGSLSIVYLIFFAIQHCRLHCLQSEILNIIMDMCKLVDIVLDYLW